MRNNFLNRSQIMNFGSIGDLVIVKKERTVQAIGVDYNTDDDNRKGGKEKQNLRREFFAFEIGD